MASAALLHPSPSLPRSLARSHSAQTVAATVIEPTTSSTIAAGLHERGSTLAAMAFAAGVTARCCLLMRSNECRRTRPLGSLFRRRLPLVHWTSRSCAAASSATTTDLHKGTTDQARIADLEHELAAVRKELSEARVAIGFSQENAVRATLQAADARQQLEQALKSNSQPVPSQTVAPDHGQGNTAAALAEMTKTLKAAESAAQDARERRATAEAAAAASSAERERLEAKVAALEKERSEDKKALASLASQLEEAKRQQANVVSGVASGAASSQAMSSVAAPSQTGIEEARAAIEAAGDVARAELDREPGGANVMQPATGYTSTGGSSSSTSVPSESEVVLPPGHYWDLPPQRYEFGQERAFDIGDTWRGVEQIGEAAKPFHKTHPCKFYRLPGLIPEADVKRVLEHVKASAAYVTKPDSVDRTPTFEYYPFQNGEWVDGALKSLLQPSIDKLVLPYVRERYGRPDCAIADILVRRYLPGERRTHAVHFDGHAFVTAVLGLTDPDDYEGGLYLQPGPDVASRMFFRIQPGDLLVHSFDLQHGVHVWKGVRYSLIFWIKDTEEAVRAHTTPWYDELAATGDPDALYALALNYANGSSGKPMDIVKAIELYERSAQSGHHFAQNNLGTLYKKAFKVLGLDSGMQKSAAWLRAAAEAGFAMAQKNYALAWAAGEGVSTDGLQARDWMRRAAEQLDVEAAHLLAEMCREGKFGTRDLSEAALWYKRSAEAGFPQAQYTLGILYFEGGVLQKDVAEAEKWFARAAAQGVDEAKNNLAAMFAQRGDVPRAADIWAELAERGEPNAECNLGMCYMRGVGRDRDVRLAKDWLEKAAAQGHKMAIHALMQL